MKLKDRLNKLNFNENQQEKITTDIKINDIFDENPLANKVIKDAYASGQNILIASSIKSDKSLINEYISKIIENESKNCVLNTADIHNFVSLIINYISGGDTFIANVNLKSYDDFLEKIKTLILFTYSNANEQSIEVLLGSSCPLVIYIAKNEDGLFYIEYIGKIKYFEKKLILEEIYSCLHKEKVDLINEDNNNLNSENDISDENNVNNKKINKYKLLREKVHNKNK